MVCDHEFVWREMTDEYAHLLGWRRSDLVGRSAWEASIRSTSAEREAVATELERTGRMMGISTIVTREGKWIPWAHSTRVLDDGGYYLSVGRPANPANSARFLQAPFWTPTDLDGLGRTPTDADGHGRERTRTDISGHVDESSRLPHKHLLTLKQVIEITQRARSSIYEDIAAGKLRTVKLGTSTRVWSVDLDEYIAKFNEP